MTLKTVEEVREQLSIVREWRAEFQNADQIEKYCELCEKCLTETEAALAKSGRRLSKRDKFRLDGLDNLELLFGNLKTIVKGWRTSSPSQRAALFRQVASTGKTDIAGGTPEAAPAAAPENPFMAMARRVAEERGELDKFTELAARMAEEPERGLA